MIRSNFIIILVIGVLISIDIQQTSAQEITYPIGYHDFNEDAGFNFQMNRWLSMGYARYEDFMEVGPSIKSFDDWTKSMLVLAEKAEADKRLLNAAFYYRAAELFLFHEAESDQVNAPTKEQLYKKFIDVFYGAVESYDLEIIEVPYGETTIQSIRLKALNGKKKGSIVIHGGYDSYKEELFSMMIFFQQHGYDVITFESPWMGSSRNKKDMGFDIEWEKPVGAILDYFNLDNVTLIGISMGGWLSLRAAAFEPRIKRVVASSVSFDVNQYANKFGQAMARFMLNKLPRFTNKTMLKQMEKDLSYAWFANHLMYVTDIDIPIEAFKVLTTINEENLHSDLVTQDVLILTGEEDHMVPVKMHHMQMEALNNAQSLTGHIFTEKEHGQNHCQVGNLGLAFETILNWILIER